MLEVDVMAVFNSAERHAILTILEAAEAAGVQFSAGDECGLFDLDPTEVLQLLEGGRDTVCAWKCGVSVAQYRTWRDYKQSGFQCTGETIAGERCRGSGDDTQDPREFRPGVSDRCHHHRIDRAARGRAIAAGAGAT